MSSAGAADVAGRVSRRTFLGAAAVGAAALASGAHAAAADRRQPGDRPNLVVILADDLAYGSLGAYGQQTLRTPNLDRMAREGIAFTDAYSGAPICAPSRCAMLTGLHTGHARVRDNSFTITGVQPELAPGDVTWAEMLRAAGYATGVFGKWGFGPDRCYEAVPHGFASGNPGGPVGDLRQDVGHPSHPLQKGFDEFVGLITHQHATDGYFPNYLWDGNRRVLLRENFDDARKTYAPELYLRRALDFMRRNRSRPFAMYLAPQLVHWPNLVPDTAPYDDMPWPEELKRYAAMYTLLDSYVGRVRRQLEALGLARNTLVVFSSDNGSTVERVAVGRGDTAEARRPSESYLGDKLWNVHGGLRSEKHSLYDGGIRVPMITWGPGIVRRDGDTVRRKPWAGWDLLPTFADLAGIRPPSDIDGVSVRGWLTGERDVARGPLYWERAQSDAVFDVSPTGFAQAVRLGRWKAVRYTVVGEDPHTPDNRWEFELYDLEIDPGETRNVAALQPGIRGQIEDIMNRCHVDPPYRRRPYRP